MTEHIASEMRLILRSDKGKAGDWYRACKMVDHINEMNAEPIQPYLKQITIQQSIRPQKRPMITKHD